MPGALNILDTSLPILLFVILRSALKFNVQEITKYKERYSPSRGLSAESDLFLCKITVLHEAGFSVTMVKTVSVLLLLMTHAMLL